MGLGLHGGGAGAARFFAKHGWRVTITDLKPKKELRESLRALAPFENIRYMLGRHRRSDFLATDLIVKGAGIPWNDPLLQRARKKNIPVESDVGIFFELCPAPIIGVTGSKGKSTVATLISLLLRKKYQNIFLAGNIRKSVLDILPSVTKKSLVVLELSSWQLEDLARHSPSHLLNFYQFLGLSKKTGVPPSFWKSGELFKRWEGKKSPHVAVITNILREHLNKYKNFAAYARAKAFIFRFQQKNDWLVMPKQDARVRNLAKYAPSRILLFSKPPFPITNPHLAGAHNNANVAAALTVAKLYGVSQAHQRAAIRAFRGLEGRLEFMAKKRGVLYYNDTTATMPDAAVAALRTLRPRTRGNIILIAGGSDKKLDFTELAKEIIKNVETAIWLPGDATVNLKSAILNLKSRRPLKQHDVRTMKEAVAKAAKVAKAGDIVLLSPGAASFGLFRHEFERGEEFIKWVKKMKN